MSSGEIQGLQNSRAVEQIQIIGTCPCLRIVDGESICINGNTIEEVEAIEVHPDLIVFAGDSISQGTQGELPICYGCVQINEEDGQVQCVSRKMPIKIRNRLLKGNQLKQAIEIFPRDRYSTDQDVCASCLYKVLNASYNGNDANLADEI